jgi:AcrR family transcriptional regulator
MPVSKRQPPTSAPAGRAALSRAAILDAALELADERGLAAASMRAIADRVGVTPMALYPYVGSKADLLDGLVDRMLGEYLPDAVGASGIAWAERLRRLAYASRDLARRHPHTFTLLFERPAVTADAVRLVDFVYQALLDAGVGDSQVPRLERLFTTFCLGFALSEVNGRFGAGTLDTRGRRAQAAPGAVPAHERLARDLDQEVDWDAEFVADVSDLVALVADVAGAVTDDRGVAGDNGSRRTA